MVQAMQFVNRSSAPAVYQLASTWNLAHMEVDRAGDVFGLLDSFERPRLPALRQRLSRRPITFHEGTLPRLDHGSPSSLDVFGVDVAFDGKETIYQHQGPTIGSIKCLDDVPYNRSNNVDIETSNDSMPNLRVDTSCPPVSASKSPLALASNFLGTLAGLIHSPSTTPIQRQATKRTSAIMIFESEVFVDFMSAEPIDNADDTERPTMSPWASPSVDWEFLVPWTRTQPQYSATCHVEEYAAVKSDNVA